MKAPLEQQQSEKEQGTSMARKVTYRSLLRQRAAVAGLTLGFVAVVIGVSLDLFFTGRRSTIPATTQRLIVPLNPQLNIGVIEAVESYELVTVEDARQGVTNQSLPSPEPITEPAFPIDQQFDQSVQTEIGVFPGIETQSDQVQGPTEQGEETFLQP